MDKPNACTGSQGHMRAGTQRRAATTLGFRQAAFTSWAAKKSLHHTKARAGIAVLPAYVVSQGHKARHAYAGGPMKTGSPPYLRGFHLSWNTATMSGTPPSRLPHHISLSSQTSTCDSLQTGPYHLPQNSSRFTSHLRASNRTTSGVILPFVSQQRADLRKLWCAWPSVRARHTCPLLLWACTAVTEKLPFTPMQRSCLHIT